MTIYVAVPETNLNETRPIRHCVAELWQGVPRADRRGEVLGQGVGGRGAVGMLAVAGGRCTDAMAGHCCRTRAWAGAQAARRRAGQLRQFEEAKRLDLFGVGTDRYVGTGATVATRAPRVDGGAVVVPSRIKRLLGHLRDLPDCVGLRASERGYLT